MGKYIFLDIDGTLYNHRENKIPESAIEAIDKAKEAGHMIFISTGRSIYQLKQINHINYDGVITSAGAYVYVDHKVLFEETISNEELNDISEICGELNIAYCYEGISGVYLQKAAQDYFELNRESRALKKEEELQELFCFYNISEYTKGEKIFKLSLFSTSYSALIRLGEMLGKDYKVVVTTESKEKRVGNMCVAELTLSHIHKASGIKKILDYYNSAFEDAIAIGDSMNDAEMIEACKVGIAMGNADARLKEIANYVTADIGEDGLYKAFAKYGLLGK
jgi:Cof subfamily protein (haloacid dehalogenase superfamily)